MSNILITGASGNIGREIIRGFQEIGTSHRVIAADYNVELAKERLRKFKDITYRELDFTNQNTFDNSLKDIEIVFLLRPPHLADIDKYFNPFVAKLKEKNIRKIVFLSVQGVENQKLIPHYKLEKLIIAENFEYIFLRPSYFMQNLTTTLVHEISTQNKIYIPSGESKFIWVDAKDIGLVGATVLNSFDSFKNSAFEITGDEIKGFEEVAEILSSNLKRKITYESPSLINFYRAKRKLGINRNMIFVMIMLHYLPRFSKKKNLLSNSVYDLTGKRPEKLAEFILREKESFC